MTELETMSDIEFRRKTLEYISGLMDDVEELKIRLNDTRYELKETGVIE